MSRSLRQAVPTAARCALVAGLMLQADLAHTQDPTPIPPSPTPRAPIPPTKAPEDEAGQPDPAANPGEAPARATGSAGMTPTSTWTFSLGLSGGYESNVNFSGTEDTSGDYLGSANASIGHTRRSIRGQFYFSLYAGGFRYLNATDRDRWDLAGSFGGSYQASPRVTFSYSAFGSYVPTNRSSVLIVSGVQLPPDQTLGYGGSLGLDARTGEKTTISLNARYNRLDFQSDEFVDTQSGHAGFSFARKLNPRNDIYLFYEFLHTADALADANNHQAALGWTHLFGRGLSLSLASGVGFSRQPPTPDSNGERWYYYGTAGLDGKIRRSSISLQLRRSANPAYGIGGNVLSWGVALTLGIPVQRWGHLLISGVNTWSEDPATKASAYVSQDAGASFSVRLVRHLSLMLSYGYRRLDPESAAPSQSHWGYFGITYSRSVPDRLPR